MVKNWRFALQINWWNFIWCEDCSLRIYWRLSTILKVSNKIVRRNVFSYTKVYIYWKFIQCKTQWDKTQMLKKIPSDKVTVTKNSLFFLSRTPTHHSFFFNSQFLYELKHIVHLSKTVFGIFHFRFVSFLLKFVFLFSKKHGLFDFKTS